MTNAAVMNSRNAVCVIVYDRERDTIAAIRRAASRWLPDPVWMIPGGKAEPGESLDNAAVRELKEETGLVVDPAALDLVHVVHAEQDWDGAGQFVLFVFATTTWTGALANMEPDKHLTARWVHAERLPDPAFPPDVQALTAYRHGGPVFSRHGWERSAATTSCTPAELFPVTADGYAARP